MAKFKDLIQEAVGGVVSIGATNQTGTRTGAIQQHMNDNGYSFDASKLPGKEENNVVGDYQQAVQNDGKRRGSSERPNSKQAFGGGDPQSSVVLHEEDAGSVTLRKHGSDSYDIVVRQGSAEKVFEIDSDSADQVRALFS